MPRAQSEFNPVDSGGSGLTRQQNLVQTLVDLVAYKYPKLKILEVKAGAEDATSNWLQSNSSPSNSIRDACSRYHFASTDSTALIAAQNTYSSSAPNAEFTMISPTVTAEILDGVKFDLAIVAISQSASAEEVRAVVASVHSSMHNNGLVLVIGQETFSPTVDIQAVLSETNLGKIHTLGDNVYLCSLVSGEQKGENNISARGIIKQVSLLPTA